MIFFRIFVPLTLLIVAVGCDSNQDVQTAEGKNRQEAKEVKATDTEVVANEKILRHAVFFSFKETSTAEDIQKITDAFADLPNKIPEIVDYQWGENNSPEGLDDGFTHCFFLSFADEKGRGVYLPHPDHKAFGELLGGHLDQVFVIDYWGVKATDRPKKELKHAVFFKFKDDADPVAVKKVEEAFAALPEKIDSIEGFEWGLNNSPEQHSHDFTHAFMVTFGSEEGREVYLPHPDHKAFVEVLKPVLDKVRVMDFWDQMTE